jgi:DinB superfamily
VFHSGLVREYLAGPALIRDAVEGMTWEQLRAKPLPGRWSTLEVVCHLADEEGAYAERMKRIIAEKEPALMLADPDEWVPRLALAQRNVEHELRLIELIRCQMAHILRGLAPEDFQRRGIHRAEGPITLVALLRRATDHIPHHVKFIQEKRVALRPTCPWGVLSGRRDIYSANVSSY